MVFINKTQRTYQVKIEQTICSSSTAIVDLVLYGYDMNCCGMLVYVVRRLGFGWESSTKGLWKEKVY